MLAEVKKISLMFFRIAAVAQIMIVNQAARAVVLFGVAIGALVIIVDQATVCVGLPTEQKDCKNEKAFFYHDCPVSGF